jgi:hypothetical protein
MLTPAQGHVLSNRLKKTGQKLVIGKTTLAEIIKWRNEHAQNTWSVDITIGIACTQVIRIVAAQSFSVARIEQALD